RRSRSGWKMPACIPWVGSVNGRTSIPTRPSIAACFWERSLLAVDGRHPSPASAAARDISMWLVSYLFAPVWAGPAERFLRYGPGLAERRVAMTIVTAMRPDQPRREIKNGIAVERIGGPTLPGTGIEAM